MSNRRTLYGTVAQLHSVLGCPIPADFLLATSLNRKLSIQPTVAPSANERATVRGFVAGIGGLTSTMGAHGLPLIASQPHTAEHAAPFYMVPIVLREVGNDLSSGERERYALRSIITKDSVNYIAYWMRRMDTSSAVIKAHNIEVVNNTTSQTDFVPNDANLSPTPVVVSVQAPNPLAGKYVRASAPVEVTLDSFDVTEMISACTILFGTDPAYANITELCVVTGVDRTVTGDNGSGGTVSYNEVIGAQAMQHISARIMLSDYPDGYTTTYDFGGSEPLFIPR